MAIEQGPKGLDVLDSIKQMHKERHQRSKFNAIITGHYGEGKTTLAETCPRPVLFHSFDPGGSRSINPELVERGAIIVDDRFEDENPEDPKMFDLWISEFNRLADADVFNSIGTYFIDTLSSWVGISMYRLLKSAGRITGKGIIGKGTSEKGFSYAKVEGVAEMDDYKKLIPVIDFCMKKILALPCCVVVTAHIELEKDDMQSKWYSSPMLPGRALRALVPTWFDEVYKIESVEGAKGNTYRLLTVREYPYYAKTRIGRGGKLNRFEPADIKGIMKKCGLDTTDLPY